MINLKIIKNPSSPSRVLILLIILLCQYGCSSDGGVDKYSPRVEMSLKSGGSF